MGRRIEVGNERGGEEMKERKQHKFTHLPDCE